MSTPPSHEAQRAELHAEVVVRAGVAAEWELPARHPAALLLTDRNVERVLPPALRALPRHVLAPGELSKTWAELEGVLQALDDHGLDRDGLLVCCGGGVVSDLGGLAAHLHRRGIAWDALPTSVIAQADAALGGKTAINLGPSKNSVGAFHAARRVLVDPSFLESLPEVELRAGFAELLKTAVISGEPLLAATETLSPQGLRSAHPEALDVLRRVIDTKLRLVQADPHDHAERQLLNLGHSFGHAFEALALGSLRHGEAVGLGLLCAARLAHDGGQLEARLRAALLRWDLPVRRAGDLGELLALMSRDKKRRGGALSLVIPEAPGHVELCPGIAPERAAEGLAAVLA
ncbi:MAG: 3-dehydroquinate synthase [Planctomycetota bacterium]|nr:MAG: 3-dehydroquinate synthase [Planctomycetota bacterium]